MIIRNMTEVECAALLDRVRLGRLACSHDGQPYVVPFHFVHRDNRLYAFSVPGKKIDMMRANPKVCVLAEEHGPARQWKTVVVNGVFEEFPDRIGSKIARDHAWSLLSKHAAWWEPGALKPIGSTPPIAGEVVFFAIQIEKLSGRESLEAE